MNLTSERFEEGFGILADLVQRGDEGLGSEYASSWSAFSSCPPAEEESDEGRARARRHLEWFLFEHERAGGARLVIDELIEAWGSLAAPDLRRAHAAYLQSQTGIYQVQSAETERRVRVQELAGLTELEFLDAELSRVLAVGDLVVGRVYPVGEGAYHISPGAGVFRDERLARALETDLARLREERGHGILRLSQRELEAMFWAPREVSGSSAVSAAGSAADLEKRLVQGGIDPAQAAHWIQVLAATPFQQDSIAPGSDGPLAKMLEVVAFETDLDLDETRRRALAAWRDLATESGAPRAAADASIQSASPREAVAEFDRDRAAGMDLEASLQALERKLGLEAEDEPDPGSAPDFPGVVGAMVEELLWETRATRGPDQARPLEGLRLFAGYARGIGVFENLTARDLLAFAAFWLPESRQLKSGAEAERLVLALGAFAEWARESQGVDLFEEGELEEHLRGLRESLPRAVVANAKLARVTDVDGELFDVLAIDPGGRARVSGVYDEEREVEVEERVAAHLQAGDFLRGHTRDDGAFVVACCYPPEAGALRRSLRQ